VYDEIIRIMPSKKICVSCRKLTYLFSKGMCKICAAASYSKGRLGSAQLKSDIDFYNSLWTTDIKYCMNCNSKIIAPTLHDKMWCSHHILPKSKYPEFRHDKRNIAILCRKCHAEAESAISYHKMIIYVHLENIKQKLLNTL